MPSERTEAEFEIIVPIRLSLGLNAREHFRVRAKRVRVEREVIHLMLWGLNLPPLPATITLTRIGKRKCDDDNVPGGAKAVRDEIAAIYGVDDGSDLYQWRYAQEIGKEYGVRITIVSRHAADGEAA
jgi:hypothetical protein